jgi:arylsulfatase A-like enzyme
VSLPITVPADPPDFNQADLTGYPGHITNRPLMTQPMIDEVHGNKLRARRALRSVDEMLETLVTALTETDQLDNTVIIYMTDNAVMMGRKRWSVENAPGGVEKKVPYQGAVDAQMRIRYPGAVTRTDPMLVATIDLPVSFAAWAGGSWTHPVDGSAGLADWLLDTPDAQKRPTLLCTFPESGGVVTWHSLTTDDGFKYVQYRNGTNGGLLPGTISSLKQVFDLNTDPWEMTNLIGVNPVRDAAMLAALNSELADPTYWEA